VAPVLVLLVLLTVLVATVAVLTLLVLLQLRSMQVDSRVRLQAAMDDLTQAELELEFLRSFHRD
jgi:hypothetical protein